jgi:NTE family protein
MRGSNMAAGRNFGTWGEIRAGIRRLRGNADVKVGQADLPSYDFDRGEFYLRLSSDELDNRNFPRNGIYGFVEYVASRQTLGADTSFDQFLIDMSGAISWGRNTVQAGGRYFSTIEGYAPVQNRFELGGLFNLSGFKEDELSGQQVGLMRVGYMRRIGDFNLIPTYIGGTLEGGNTWEDRDAMDLDELILVASIYLGLDTFLGPIYLAYGQAENDNKSLYFYLGKIF